MDGPDVPPLIKVFNVKKTRNTAQAPLMQLFGSNVSVGAKKNYMCPTLFNQQIGGYVPDFASHPPGMTAGQNFLNSYIALNSLESVSEKTKTKTETKLKNKAQVVLLTQRAPYWFH